MELFKRERHRKRRIKYTSFEVSSHYHSVNKTDKLKKGFDLPIKNSHIISRQILMSETVISLGFDLKSRRLTIHTLTQGIRDIMSVLTTSSFTITYSSFVNTTTDGPPIVVYSEVTMTILSSVRVKWT